MQCINGMVMKGNQHGRLIGFPTANIIVKDLKIQYGVWATKTVYLKKCFYSISYFTLRENLELLETHIFDFEKEIYGESIQVELVEFLRPPIHFDSEDKLIEQLQNDCQKTKEILKNP
jgi:riboflavin kinase / FMN adenylyltransferase